jgi:hypothetical protein
MNHSVFLYIRPPFLLSLHANRLIHNGFLAVPERGCRASNFHSPSIGHRYCGWDRNGTEEIVAVLFD